MKTNLLKERFSLVSGLFSLLCICGVLIINQQIAIRYQEADGKTKAVFGIVEYLQYSYKYYLVFPALIGLVLGIATFKKDHSKETAAVAVLLACMAVALVFLRVWRLLV